ncbi:hypothetical protein QYF61_017294 [Mycteria americana]|uniref:Uncharacterized protein n=1 Tax=Mycteria americana TaxID=33587 RepID=A0AAN7RTN3_MYCAM|nr:hypothetical protein QYF61_017294 [Mycteria americana]
MDPGKQLFPSIQHLQDCIWTTASNFEVPSTRKTLTFCSESSRGQQDSQGTGARGNIGGEAQRTGFVQPGEEKGRGRDLTSVYSYLLGGHREDGARLFLEVHDNKMRGNGRNLQHQKFPLDIRVLFYFIFLVVRVVKYWNRLAREVVKLPSLEVFKSQLDKSLTKLADLYELLTRKIPNFSRALQESLNQNFMLIVTHREVQREYHLNFSGSSTIQEVKRNVYDLTSIPVRHQLWEGWPPSATDDSQCTDVHMVSDSDGDDFEDATEFGVDDGEMFGVASSALRKSPMMPENAENEGDALLQFTAEFSSRSQSLRLEFTLEFQPVQCSSSETAAMPWPSASPGASPLLSSECSQAQQSQMISSAAIQHAAVQQAVKAKSSH